MNHDRLSHLFQPRAMVLNDPAMPCQFSSPAVIPNLVACIVHPSLMSVAQGLYQLAYEQALAATRISRFEVTTRAWPN